MTDAPMVAPLTLEFAVAVDVEHAFTTWVERADLWWPRDHTLSGSPDAIIFEPRVGGRIYERDAQGAEMPWGEVVVWDPPTRLEYRWHLFFRPEEATHVSIAFERSNGGTTVRVVQTGFDALAEQGPLRREGNARGWAAVSTAYRTHLEHASRS